MTELPDEPAALIEGGGLVRYRFDMSYDGTDFCGWARQTAQRSVQGDVEDAIATVLHLPSSPRLIVAGRTDAGVHAVGQVAHADLPDGIDCHHLLRGLNGVLARDVRITGLAVAAAGFDARFSPLRREYRYRVSDAPYGVPPLSRHDTAHHGRALDVDAMNEAAAQLIGLNDFVAFCRRRDGATTIRSLEQLSCARDGDVVVVDVAADAFCHSMVRSLVGALIAVGDGRRDPSWSAKLLITDRRSDDVVVAPARGLTLVRVVYPADAELAIRAQGTRRLRDAADLAASPDPD